MKKDNIGFQESETVQESNQNQQGSTQDTQPARKGIAKWIAWITALGVLSAVLLAGMLVYMEKSRDYKNRLENVYQQSFYDASASMDNIEVKLSKMLISSSASQRAELSADIWRQSSLTAVELSNLPVDNEGIVETMKFVNQLGDYAHCLNNKLANGEELTEEEESMLESLHERATALNAQLRDFSEKMAGSYKISDHISVKAKDKLGNSGLNGALGTTDSNAPDYPKLIYDGPFSDSLEAKDYRFLNDKPVISEQEGASYVRERLGFEGAKVSCLGLIEGETRMLFYSIEGKAGDEAYVQLSERGGYPLVLSSSKDAPSSRLSDEEAITKAEQLASKLFGAELKGVWYTKGTDNTAYVNLAPITDDIVYYTDLVKVKISLYDGSVLGIESRAFLINHAPKELEPVLLSEGEALTVVSKKMNVSGIRLAVIPLENDRYCLTYEIHGNYKDYTFMVYINASSGEEEQILRTINNAQGEMLM